MTTTLVVLAHPERSSFNGAWAEATASAAKDLGDHVLWSDLNAQRFNPVENAAHYPDQAGSRSFDPLKAQELAVQKGVLPDDVRTEADKIKAADRIIFHFPLWWFAPPAILKGWFDRVLLHGGLHDVDNRFDKGMCRGKKALFCVTTGSTAQESAHNGKEGDAEMLLWPMAYTLRYLGFDVLAPICVHGVHGYHEGEEQQKLQDRLAQVLRDQHGLMGQFDALPMIQFNRDDDFDDEGRLSQDRPSYSAFIRHARRPEVQ